MYSLIALIMSATLQHVQKYIKRNESCLHLIQFMIQYSNFRFGIPTATKGQLISKPIYDLLTSPKKRTDEFDLFAVKSKKANKSNWSVRFFGEVSRS